MRVLIFLKHADSSYSIRYMLESVGADVYFGYDPDGTGPIPKLHRIPQHVRPQTKKYEDERRNPYTADYKYKAATEALEESWDLVIGVKQCLAQARTFAECTGAKFAAEQGFGTHLTPPFKPPKVMNYLTSIPRKAIQHAHLGGHAWTYPKCLPPRWTEAEYKAPDDLQTVVALKHNYQKHWKEGFRLFQDLQTALPEFTFSYGDHHSAGHLDDFTAIRGAAFLASIRAPFLDPADYACIKAMYSGRLIIGSRQSWDGCPQLQDVLLTCDGAVLYDTPGPQWPKTAFYRGAEEVITQVANDPDEWHARSMALREATKQLIDPEAHKDSTIRWLEDLR